MAVETLADAAIVIHPDFSKAKSEATAGAKSMGESAGKTAGDTFFDKFGKTFEAGKRRISSGMEDLANAITIGFGVGGVVKFGIQAAASLEQAKVGFTTLLGSATKAGTYIKQLQSFAAATPFTLPGLIDSSRTLLGVGVSSQKVIPMLRAFGDAAGAVGVGQDAFQRIIIATSQAISAGRFQIQDLNQIMTDGIPVYTLLSQAMGKPVSTIRKMATEGKLLSKDVLPVLQKQMEKDYGGAMAKQSQTLAGVWSTLTDTVSQGLASAITPLIPIFSTLIPKAATVTLNIFRAVASFVAALVDGILKGKVTLTGFGGVLQSVGAKFGGFLSAFTSGVAKVGSLGAPYAKLGNEIRDKVIPAHIELARSLLTEVGPAIVRLVTSIAVVMIPIMYRLEEVVKGHVVPAIETLTNFLTKHQKIVTDVALVLGGLVAANKLVEVSTKALEFATTLWSTALKLASGTIKIFEVSLKAGEAALKAYAIAFNLDKTTMGVWIGLKWIEIKQFLTEAIAAEESTISIIAHAAATKIAAAATAVWTAVQKGFNIVMDAAGGPIGLAVLAIAALVAGIIYAYKHSATFRDIVQGAWKVIKIAIADTVNFIVHTVWPGLVKAWDGIATGALWLWHNAIDPVWHGIQNVIGVVVAIVRGYIGLLVAEWRIVATVAQWLYNNILAPVFHVIGRVIQAAMAVALLAMKLVQVFIIGPLARDVQWFYNKVIAPTFHLIAAVISTDIAIAKAVLTAIRNYIVGELTAALTGIRTHAQQVWNAITGFFSKAWNTIHGYLSQFSTFMTKNMSSAMASFSNATGVHWSSIQRTISSVWNVIKGVFNALVGFVEHTIPNAFNTAVGAIGKAWQKIQDVVKAPITFTVNHVINPLISGFDRVAKAFGTPTINPIGGFAEGGRIPGTPSSTDNKWAWLKGKAGQTLGTVGVATGEYVVNARDTAKALPLLQWINDGMKGGAENVARYLGRPITNMPGDGSEGWAFSGGGLVGFLKDVWGAVSNPVGLIKKPVEEALSSIPGSGLVKDMLVGMGQKLISGLLGFMTGSSSGAATGSVGAAQTFLRAQNGKPYIWASAGPQGYDCSGIVSAVYNILKHRSIYSHTFSTESAAPFFPKPGLGGPLVAGWSHPGQAPAGASVGHMMSMVGGLTFESTGGRGVHLGSTTRRVSDFANVGHFDRGGIVKLAQIARADFGSTVLERGNNLIFNGTGQREPMVSPSSGPSRMHPDDILALAEAIGGVVGGALISTVPLTRVASRKNGSRR